ncbi:proton channel OTOP2-like [Oscarella lobularis]|uniref:proton channel OTOP2-like n=1 Tax=Oscarella lobularis TaxID=121494 RepID=UPI00331425FA
MNRNSVFGDSGDEDIQELRAPLTQTRDSARERNDATNDRRPSAERRSKIVVWPIIVLCSGIILEVRRFGPIGRPKLHVIPQLKEYAYAEYFDIASMSLAILWILSMIVNALRTPHGGRGHKGHVFPLVLLGTFGIIGGVALSFLQALSFFVYPCSSTSGKVYALMKIVFILIQVVGITYFKRKPAIINRTVINGSLLYHTVVCNVVLYIRTFIESKGDFRPPSPTVTTPAATLVALPYSSMAPPINCNDTINDIIKIYKDLSPYLYPFFLEFTLTSSAMLAEIWLEDNHETTGQTHHPSETSLPRAPNQNRLRKMTAMYPHIIFISAIAVAVAVGVYLHVNSSTSGYNPAITLYSYRIAVAVLMIATCIAGYLSTNGKSRKYNGGFDEVLLVIGSIGVFAFAAVEVVASLACLMSKDKDLEDDAEFALAENGFWVIEAALQMMFLSRALHREATPPRNGSRCSEMMHTAKLTFLLFLLNLLMWAIDTVHVEGHVKGIYAHETRRRINALEDKYLGKSYWDYTFLIIYPLRIFFRIHSAALFFRAFNAHKRVPVPEEAETLTI